MKVWFARRGVERGVGAGWALALLAEKIRICPSNKPIYNVVFKKIAITFLTTDSGSLAK